MPFIDIQGKNAHYQQNGEFRTDKSTLLFVHGAGGTGNKWVHQLTGIEGYNLIALDLPGHGRSEGEAADTIIAYREFVWQFVQTLKLGPFVIAGHSMGGAIAMEFALAYPDLLIGLIIVDSGARLKVNPETLEVLSRGEHPLGNVKYSYSLKASQAVLERATQEMKTVPTEVLLADFRACDSFNLMDRVQSINLPTLVLCGQDDQMTPVKYSEYLAKQLAQSILVLIPDAGHSAMIEQSEPVNRAIQDFMDTIRRISS
ncbi:MAG: alpha/beta fold hydrolase [Desulfitobacteriaceae bacterium]